jgi:hypothetical protein
MTTDLTPPHDGDLGPDGLGAPIAALQATQYVAPPALAMRVRGAIRRRLFAAELTRFLWTAPFEVVVHCMQMFGYVLGFGQKTAAPTNTEEERDT